MAHAQNEPKTVLTHPSDPDPQLSPRQLAAIAMLFSGRSYSEVGRRLKIDRKTLFRWRHWEPFAAEIHRHYLATTRPRERPGERPGEAARWRDVLLGDPSRAAAATAGRR